VESPFLESERGILPHWECDSLFIRLGSQSPSAESESLPAGRAGCFLNRLVIWIGDFRDAFRHETRGGTNPEWFRPGLSTPI